MTASSAVVISNLAYLVGAIVLAVIGGLLVWLRHRKPKSVAANVESFHRGLQALAPDRQTSGGGVAANGPESRQVTAQPGIRLAPARSASPEEPGPASQPASAAGADGIDLTDQESEPDGGNSPDHGSGVEAGEAAADRAGAETG